MRPHPKRVCHLPAFPGCSVAKFLKALLTAVLLSISVSVSAQPAAQAAFDAAVADAKDAMLRNPQITIASADQAEALIGQLSTPVARNVATATAYWLKGEAYMRLGQLNKAESLINDAYALTDAYAPTSKLHADVMLSKGGIDAAKLRVAQALRSYQAAFRIYRKLDNGRSQALTLVLMAALYSDAKDYQNAIKYLTQARQDYKADDSLTIAVFNNMAVIWDEMGRHDKAKAPLNDALAAATRIDSPILQGQILRNLARNRLKVHQIAAANRAIQQARTVLPNPDDTDRRSLLSVSAQAALQQGDVARAGQLIGESFAGVDLSRTTIVQREAHQTAFETYRALGEAERALAHLVALKRLDDEATKLATTTSTALMGARFDFANQELRIATLKANDLQRKVLFERAQARTQRWILIGTVAATAIIIALLGIWLFTLQRSRNAIRAANDDLAETNAALGKALAAKTEFLATTSHEIRTPLNGILGMTEVMLTDRGLSADLRDRLGVVHGAGITMRALVDDILDVAKMETGRLTIEQAPYDLEATIRDASRLWEEQAAAKGLSFALALGECPRWVQGDAARVRQIVFNLLSNAMKFTQAGSVGLSGWCEGEMLHIRVRDTGIGIPPDKLEDIFESFRQADASTTRRFGGTGLGLAICRNLARAMGGDVAVASRVGEGADFTLTLPLVRAAAPDAVEIPDERVLLVVDRNPIQRAMWRSLFAAHGAVAFAASAEDAATRMAQGHVAAVLVDEASVRDEGAVEAIAAAARGGPPVALLWPAPDPERIAAWKAAGITQVIAKPVAGAAVVAALFGPSRHGEQVLVSQAA
ncbi:Signal transduction histidine kinase [Sphingomonas carotinifaciens]|uniref:histidine kinase n=1 Tax=Sphingomonas carotinifaciens TaxID=1166323 RepID=A0A1G7K8B4_9SPHN|nr:Signal transduction histidine kinase [Sphingomonas carotinifaciens]